MLDAACEPVSPTRAALDISIAALRDVFGGQTNLRIRSFKRINQLLAVAVRHRVAFDADCAQWRLRLIEGTEEVVPYQPELPEIDLRVREALPMVPAMEFCHA